MDFGDYQVDTPRKQRHFIDKSYQANVLEPGWFMQLTADFESSLGHLELLNSIEYLYMLKKYDQCLERCDLFLELNSKRSKKLKDDEVLEIASRCCARLEKPDKYFMQIKWNKNSPGLQMFMAETLYRQGNFIQTIQILLRYLEYRKGDYVAFSLMSDCFGGLARIYPSFADSFAVLAFQSLAVSLELVNKANQPETAFKEAFFKSEVLKLEEKLQSMNGQGVISPSIWDEDFWKTEAEYEVHGESLRVKLSDMLSSRNAEVVEQEPDWRL